MKPQPKISSEPWLEAAHCYPDRTRLSIRQTAQLSGVSEADLLDLVGYGVLVVNSPRGGPCTFDLGCVMKLQRAALMRQELALDGHGFAITLMFLNQITALESKLLNVERDHGNSRSLSAIKPTND